VNGVCLLVAGALRATMPGPDFTVAWIHSVEKTRWEERYVIAGDVLLLVDASVLGNGAGMEPPAGATLRDGRWTWHPRSAHAELRLTRSTFVQDYTICAADRCAGLGDRIGPTPDGEVVTVRAC
jgi:hypothetical protein